jgi:thioredoxin-like negative regulator of GroEL
MTMQINPERVYSGETTVIGNLPIVVEFTSSRARVRPIAHRAGGIELAGSGRLPVRAVDIDAQPDLRRRFRVELVPTFVVLQGAREVARLVGPYSRRELAAALRRALGKKAVAVEPPEPRALWNDFTTRLWGFRV